DAATEPCLVVLRPTEDLGRRRKRAPPRWPRRRGALRAPARFAETSANPLLRQTQQSASGRATAPAFARHPEPTIQRLRPESFRPPRGWAPRRNAMKHPFRADVLVDIGPMHTL